MLDHVLYDFNNFLSFISTRLIFHQEIVVLAFDLKEQKK